MALTFADYLTWNESEHIELIDGEAVKMSLPPTVHQLISGEILRQIANFLEGKKCLAIPAPFSVLRNGLAAIYGAASKVPRTIVLPSETITTPFASTVSTTRLLSSASTRSASAPSAIRPL